MNRTLNRNLFWQIPACTLFFALVTLIYFSPILDGKRIKQHDIEMYKGMSKEITDYREATGEQSLWTNSMFSGMPAWNISVKNNSNLIQPLNQALKVGFPQSIGAVFISMLGFFLLLLVLDCGVWTSLVGGLAYGLTSYLFIIIGAGHSTKAMAMAYMAPVIAGVLLTYKGKYLWGSVLTAIALALEVRANHLQITYYLLIIIVIIFIAQLISTYKGKYLWGCVLAAIALAFEVHDNHPANHLKIINYYLLLILNILLVAQLIREIIKKKTGFLKATGCLIVAAILGILTNTTTLYANYKYSQDTTRGKPVLVQDNANQTQGLERDYITQWSYGQGETWSLMIPNAKGGSSAQIGMKEPALKQANPQFKEVIAQQNAYWGDQPFTSGPVYVGAIVVFLFILSGCLLFNVNDKTDLVVLLALAASTVLLLILRIFGIIICGVFTSIVLSVLLYLLYKGFRTKPLWAGLWLATILSILLAWGKNFMGFTDFFIDHIPGYSKFRAVSMTLVIAEVCMPLVGFLGLSEIIKNPSKQKRNRISFFIALGITAGCCILFYLSPKLFFNFLSQSEAQQFAQLTSGRDGAMYQAFASQLEDVRVAIFRRDTLRSLLLILFAAIPVYALIVLTSRFQGKEKKQKMVAALLMIPIGILVLIDLIPIDLRYLNNNNFISKRLADKPFTASNADQYILKDNTLDFRVVNLTKDVFNDASTSYFHKSVGGYHGAKLRRYQDLINGRIIHGTDTVYGYLNPEIQRLRNANTTQAFSFAMAQQQTLNMLNTKYIIYNPQAEPIENPYAFGNAWIVNDVRWVDTPNEEFETIGTTDLRHTAILHKEFQNQVGDYNFTDSIPGQVTLTEYKPNKLTYSFKAASDQLVVFSEIWSDTGWKLYVDGKEHPLLRANYVLRSALIPSGEHQIVMKYEPSIWKTGNRIQLASSSLLLLGLALSIVLSVINAFSTKNMKKENQA